MSYLAVFVVHWFVSFFVSLCVCVSFVFCVLSASYGPKCLKSSGINELKYGDTTTFKIYINLTSPKWNERTDRH